MTKRELKEQLTQTIALLQISGVGRMRFNRLVSLLGSPKNVLNASISQLERINGISRTIASCIKTEKDIEKSAEIASRIIQLGWTPLFNTDQDYPQRLKESPSAPPLLFRVGKAMEQDEPSIAIVGTRRCTDRGRKFAFQLAQELARAGVTVVSGMAEGIDSAAHRGALESGGNTVAVWGSSLDIVFPKLNEQLARQIAENGAVYSEYLPGSAPTRTTFPERNRIISGLSMGVVVVEASQKSGALITASHALEQGRGLFAVPGHPDNRTSIGCNNLLKKGARLLTSIDDIFEELPCLKGEISPKKFVSLPEMTSTEKRIVDLFSEEPLQIDNISRSMQLPVSELMEFMLALELKGVIRELSGKRFALADEYQ